MRPKIAQICSIFVATARGSAPLRTDMEAPPLERKLVAILAADVEGYSRHDGDRRGGHARDALGASHHHRRADRPAQRPHLRHRRRQRAGRIRQRVLRRSSARSTSSRRSPSPTKPLDEARRMRFRIGINVGDVMVKDGDIFGDGVNIAARLEGAGRARRHLHFARRARPYPPQAAAHVRGSRRAGGQEHRPAGALLSPASRRRQARAAAAARADLAAVRTAQGAARPTTRRSSWCSGSRSRTARSRATTKPIFRSIPRAASPRWPMPGSPNSPIRTARRAPRPTPTSSGPSGNPSATATIRESVQAYLDKYPAGEFCALAEIRLKELGETPATAK